MNSFWVLLLLHRGLFYERPMRRVWRDIKDMFKRHVLIYVAKSHSYLMTTVFLMVLNIAYCYRTIPFFSNCEPINNPYLRAVSTRPLRYQKDWWKFEIELIIETCFGMFTLTGINYLILNIYSGKSNSIEGHKCQQSWNVNEKNNSKVFFSR